ncbi:hypothetical protein FAZ95_25370 [Trinickia violacea]|uniref:Alginate lyase domain-containing protein n=1 Tax=Trinickia violacea TaxID=2571746 RepID=A0A4V1EI46_9BURK|nr:alginate lyase family protein [Trinickia violacea]QCP52500.1 hypothetical protein FAZ95_25370 [Trinickia violacea]
MFDATIQKDHRARARHTLAVIASAFAFVAFTYAPEQAQACEVPPPLASIDVPGFYDDPAGYSREIAPLHAFIERVNKAADAGDKTCLLDLLPLVFTAELARARGVDLYDENHGAIKRLANVLIEAVQNPDSFSAYSATPQKLFPWTFESDLAWMEPYYARFHDPRLPALMATRRPFINLRLGGNVTAAWS